MKRGLKPLDFRIDNAVERFQRVGDIFAPVLAGTQRLEDALQRINQLNEEMNGRPAKKRGITKKPASNATRS